MNDMSFNIFYTTDINILLLLLVSQECRVNDQVQVQRLQQLKFYTSVFVCILG